MIVLQARNVRDAYYTMSDLVRYHGIRETVRGGKTVLSLPEPLITVYERPQERVLITPKRRANPFFHLFESLWMLSGSRDARWLDQFVHDFSSRFAEDDGLQHGAYGYRWRCHFDMDGGDTQPLDQLDEVVHLLRQDRGDRRIVISMWDPVADLGRSFRDVPCNTHCYLRIVDGHLCLTVCCRSNDMVWGAYGANAVHFSVLQEYLAGRIGVCVGKMYQLSNNFHVYEDILGRLETQYAPHDGGYYGVSPTPMGEDWSSWDSDVAAFVAGAGREYANSWFHRVADPMMRVHRALKSGDRVGALALCEHIDAPDWRIACTEFLTRGEK